MSHLTFDNAVAAAYPVLYLTTQDASHGPYRLG